MCSGGLFNKLSIILKENKLSGPDFDDWKRNMNIVLTACEFKCVFVKPCPEIGEEITHEEKEAEKVWKKANEMARHYIFASMSNMLQAKHKNMTFTYDTDISLKEMFGDKSRPIKQAALKTIINTKIAKRAFVIEHILKMITILEEPEV